MKVSFIVVTYRRGKVLQVCLDSIYAQSGLSLPYEIIIIDNGGDAEIVPPSNPQIQLRIERPEQNLWAAGGRNLGIQLAQGEFLVLLDDDAAWHADTDAAQLISHLEKDAKCGCAAGISLTPDGVPIPVELPHPNKAYVLSAKTPIEVPYCFVTGIVFRADIVKRLGGYPTRFGIYMEEIDLSLRLIDAGYRIVYDPAIATYHYKSNAGRSVVGDKYWKASAINKSRFAWRLLPQPYPFTTLFIWTMAAVIKSRNPMLLWDIWKSLWTERALIRRERKPVRPETIRYLKSIGARLWY
ncbi:MAG: glycosyltransferase family 2 protein [Chloroflexota bacterium]